MKIIYFEADDRRILEQFQERSLPKWDYLICRGSGYKYNEKFVSELLSTSTNYTDYTILTNDEQFIESQYCWKGLPSDPQGYHNLWFVIEGDIVLAQDTTDKKLRYAHNLQKLYSCGIIGQERYEENNGTSLQKRIIESVL